MHTWQEDTRQRRAAIGKIEDAMLLKKKEEKTTRCCHTEVRSSKAEGGERGRQNEEGGRKRKGEGEREG
jgi:hypothetical protein